MTPKSIARVFGAGEI